jgi:ubiquinone/menaquinone biosynthesis C-methylase UbiE
MAVRVDLENNETRDLFSMADLSGKRVLEIGCGDGRLTWRYAGRASHVTAVDPWGGGIANARKNMPSEFQGRIEFHCASFLDFATSTESSAFDIAILSWSL